MFLKAMVTLLKKYFDRFENGARNESYTLYYFA